MTGASEILDVAVAGGGPAGLALALALRSAIPDIKVKVFERAPQLKVQGAGLRIEPNGMKALQALDSAVYQEAIDNGKAPSKLIRGSFNSTEPMAEMDMSAMMRMSTEKYGAASFFVGWSDLQSLLYRHLPDGVVQLGHAFQSFQTVQSDHDSSSDAEPLLDVQFAAEDGSQQPPPVRTRLLVGCDGLFSKIRRQWLNDAPPEDAGYTVWRGRLPVSACQDSIQEAAYLISGGHRVFAFYPGNRGWFVWNASTSGDVIEAAGLKRLLRAGDYSSIQHSLQTMSPSEKGALHKERALKLFAGLPAELQAAVAATDPDHVLEHNLFYRPARTYPTDGKLGDGPVTLAGDAAHVIRPTGQGTSQAFEDAVALATAIVEEGLCSAALRAYEAKRLPRWKLAAAGSQQDAQQAYQAQAGAKPAAASNEPLLDLKQVEAELCGIQFKPLTQLRTSAAAVRRGVSRSGGQVRTVAAGTICRDAQRGAATGGLRRAVL